MANTILTPGEENIEQTPIERATPYLEKDNYLSEFQTDGEKAVARENLDVYSKDSVYNKTESDILLDKTIKQAFDKYLNTEDPHGILPTVEDMIEGMIRNDGTTPFLMPQKGVDPVLDYHLATKRFVTKLLKLHIDSEDPHRILPEVEDILELYVKQSLVYFKDQLYTKNEIDLRSNLYLKGDGTTPFTKPQVGADPQIDSHLSTKRYVDLVMYKHLVDVDPHGFISILNKRLASYAKANNVYDKTLTYSRVLIDSIIRSLVHEAAKEAIVDHLNEFDPHNILAEVKKLKFVKLDGSTPFKNPQKGADAVDPLDLVTLHQVEEKVQSIEQAITKIPEPIWKTSGPVLTTVGFVENESVLAKEVTLQEIMDAIFYGKGITITAEPIVRVGDSTQVTVCILGSLATMQYGELYLGEQLIETLTRELFEETGCITVNSLPIKEDTKFTFKVYYMNGSIHEVETIVKIALPIFVGILPKWKFGNTITYDYLYDLFMEDPQNNLFYDFPKKLTELPPHNYNFIDLLLRHPFMVIPANYPDLYYMSTPSLQFREEAFDIIDMIPLQVPGSDSDVIYKIYIYRLALALLNIPVTFKFKTE